MRRVILAIICIAAFAGCKKSEDNSIVGKWKCTYSAMSLNSEAPLEFIPHTGTDIILIESNGKMSIGTIGEDKSITYDFSGTWTISAETITLRGIRSDGEGYDVILEKRGEYIYLAKTIAGVTGYAKVIMRFEKTHTF